MRRSESARIHAAWRLLAAGAATASTVVAAGAAPAAPRGPAEITAFKPTADTYVTAAQPRANFGRSPVLRVDGSPVATAYLRFNPGRVSGDVASVTLLLHTRAARKATYEVRQVADDKWRETRLTFRNAPRLSLRYTASRPVRRGAWSAVDVTAFVTEGGKVNLAVTTRGTRALSFGSRESKHGPRLVVHERRKEREPPRPVSAAAGAQ